MRESDLRKYIRKEMCLQEAAGDLAYSDVKGIFDAFKNVFTVAGIALKSVVSALVLNVQVAFTLDPKDAEEYFRAYETRLSNITREYESALTEANKLIDDFSPLLFIANPAAYAAFHTADAYSGNFAAARNFLQDVGLDESSRAWSREAVGDATQKILAFLAGKTTSSGEKSALEKISSEQSKIRQRLDSLFGAKLSESRVPLGGLLTEAKVSPDEMNLNDLMKHFIVDVLPKVGPEAFGVSSDSARAALDLKRQEADEFARILESPAKFLTLLGSAKTLDDVKRAVTELKKTPFTITGIEKLSPQFLDSASREAIAAAKKGGKLADLLTTVGLKEEPKDEAQLLAAVKAYQLKTLLGQTFLKASDSLAKGVEELRAKFLAEFERDAPLATVSKVAPGSELEKILKDGIEKIENAGKRKSQT